MTDSRLGEVVSWSSCAEWFVAFGASYLPLVYSRTRFTQLWKLPAKLGGRVAAEVQDAARMAEACGGGTAPDGHNPEVVPPA